jgi:hypothetical protein
MVLESEIFWESVLGWAVLPLLDVAFIFKLEGDQPCHKESLPYVLRMATMKNHKFGWLRGAPKFFTQKK